MTLRNCIVRFFRIIAIIFNVVFVLAALFLIILGAIFMSEVGAEAKQNRNLGIICLFIGSLVFLVAFLGCCGAHQKNRCKLISYIVIVFLIFFIQMVLAIMAFLSLKNMHVYVEKNLYEMKDNYYVDNNVKNRFDFVQTKFKCCGAKGVEDWGSQIPRSCCADPEKKCDKNTTYIIGCSKLVSNYFKNLAGIIGYAAIICALVEISGASLAVLMVLFMNKDEVFMIVPK